MSRSELKKQAILTAAREVFKSQGVQSTSMDKLAEVAGVSKRTVYNHFKTKEDLVMYLVRELWQKAMFSDDNHYDASKPLAPQLTKLALNEIALMSSQDYIDLSRVAVGHFFYQPEALVAEVEKMSKQETSIHKWLENAQKDNNLAIDDIEFANHQLHSLIKGGCFWPQLMGLAPLLTPKEQRELAHESVAMFLARYEKS